MIDKSVFDGLERGDPLSEAARKAHMQAMEAAAYNPRGAFVHGPGEMRADVERDPNSVNHAGSPARGEFVSGTSRHAHATAGHDFSKAFCRAGDNRLTNIALNQIEQVLAASQSLNFSEIAEAVLLRLAQFVRTRGLPEVIDEMLVERREIVIAGVGYCRNPSGGVDLTVLGSRYPVPVLRLDPIAPGGIVVAGTLRAILAKADADSLEREQAEVNAHQQEAKRRGLTPS